jgi:hypothetical protein
VSMRSSASAICAVRADRRACAADGERADDDAQLVVRVGATSLGGRDRLDPRDAAERSGLGELLGHDLARQARRFRQLRNGKSSSAASVLRPAASPTASRCSGRPTAATSSAGKGLPVQPHLPLSDQPAVRADREARRGRKRRLDARLLVVCDGDRVLGTSSRRATAASSPAGTHRDANRSTGSLILKLDGGGAVQWQTLLRPLERTYAYLYAVQPTADGGYVAAGTFYPLSDTGTGAGVVAVKVDANGKVHWQRGFNSFDSSGAPTAGENVESVIQTSDGGLPPRGHLGWRRHRPRGVSPGAASAEARRERIEQVAEGLQRRKPPLAALLLRDVPVDGQNAEPVLRLVGCDERRRPPGGGFHRKSQRFRGRALRRSNGQRRTRRRLQPDPSCDPRHGGRSRPRNDQPGFPSRRRCRSRPICLPRRKPRRSAPRPARLLSVSAFVVG